MGKACSGILYLETCQDIGCVTLHPPPPINDTKEIWEWKVTLTYPNLPFYANLSLEVMELVSLDHPSFAKYHSS